MVTKVLVAEMFMLDVVERIEQWIEGDVHFYLFQLDGLFTKERRVAIDIQSGITHICNGEIEDAIEAETQLDEIEMCLLIAVVLSYPYTVATYQMLALSTCRGQGIIEVKEALQKKAYESLMQPLRAVILACNEKLRPLGIAINVNDQETEYQIAKESIALPTYFS